jgi:hypothetical protein
MVRPKRFELLAFAFGVRVLEDRAWRLRIAHRKRAPASVIRVLLAKILRSLIPPARELAIIFRLVADGQKQEVMLLLA